MPRGDQDVKEEIIWQSHAEWAKIVVLNTKNYWSLRFRMDYRQLNSIRVLENYPVTRMDKWTDSLVHTEMFSTLDWNSEYWKVPIDLADRERSSLPANRCCKGSCAYYLGSKMLSVRYKERSISHCLHESCSMIWCTPRTDESIWITFETLVTLLHAPNTSQKLKTCKFFKDTLGYLGHVIWPDKIEVTFKKLKGSETVCIPQDQSGVRSFLLTCNVYRKYTKSFGSSLIPWRRSSQRTIPLSLKYL